MPEVRLRIREAEEGDLPAICMRCGEPAETHRQKEFTYQPWWLLSFLLLGCPGLIIFFIVANVIEKKVRLKAPLCNRHQEHWTHRTKLIAHGLGLLVLLAVLCFLLSKSDQVKQVVEPGYFVPVGAFALFVAWIVSYETSIHATKITDTEVTLVMVSSEFIATLELHRRPESEALAHFEESDVSRPFDPHARGADDRFHDPGAPR